MNHTIIDQLLLELARLGGSDLHITASKPNYFRVKKEITPCSNGTIFNNNDIIQWIKYVSENNNNFIKESAIENVITGTKDLDFSYSLKGQFGNSHRYRVHVYCTRGGRLAIAFRRINDVIPTPEQLKLPSHYREIVDYPQGLVLISGATGSGKSTTIASLIELINQKHRKHILTLEDPIEFVFEEKQSLIHQKEVGKDVATFRDGIKSALREDPDVILLGEIRDQDEMINALTLSASGHLVFATIHTSGVLHTIGRILSLFSGEDEGMIRGLLQDNLKCIINQSLYKTSKNVVVPLLEHVFTDHSTYRIFGDMKEHQVKAILQTTSNADKTKMMFRWQSILNYYNNGEIDYPEAKKLIEMFDIDNIQKFEAQKVKR